MSIARVALDTPLYNLFDYAAAGILADDIGRLVRVPFGTRKRIGVIFELTDSANIETARLKTIEQVLHDVPALSKNILTLLRFSADYYQYPVGQAVMATLPPLLRGGTPPEPRLFYALLGPPGGTRFGPVQRKIIEALTANGVLAAKALRGIAPSASTALKALLERGIVQPAPQPADSTPAGVIANESPLRLSEAQQHAVDRVFASDDRLIPALLFGVTGSGKTEVYLQLVAKTLARGEQALVLAPEINLTPQLEQRFRQRFPSAEIVFAHSGLPASARRAQWLAAAEGRADIVIGTRLAVFIPLPRLGLIVVDEEHDSSFKQQERFRYSARDIAVFRAHDNNIPIVLGSATPSLETYHNAKQGRYRLLELKQRAHAAALPPVIECVDTRAYKPLDGLSLPLLSRLRENLAQGEQSLVFINRRGFAPVLWCRGCAWAPTCTRCSANMAWHKAQRHLCCHHCGRTVPQPPACPQCGAPDLTPLGEGSQRVEQALEAALPEARICRVDADSMRPKNRWRTVERAMRDGEVDILAGTQMLAKGHDFPNLSLVGVINVDGALLSADFRAAERLFALLVQVTGRAGRAGRPGRAMIQTAYPDHPLFSALKAHDYAGYADLLLEQRQRAGFPPFRHQALIRAEAPALAAALAFLAAFASVVEELGLPVKVYDPVAARMAKVAGRERAQLLLQAAKRQPLQLALTQARARFSGNTRNVRWAIDVDPQDF